MDEDLEIIKVSNLFLIVGDVVTRLNVHIVCKQVCISGNGGCFTSARRTLETCCTQRLKTSQQSHFAWGGVINAPAVNLQRGSQLTDVVSLSSRFFFGDAPLVSRAHVRLRR